MKRYLLIAAAAVVPGAVWMSHAAAQSQAPQVPAQPGVTAPPTVRVVPKAGTTSLSFAQGFGIPSSLGKTVTVEIDNATARDAFKTVLDNAKQEFVMDEDVPQDARVSLRAANVRLSTALDVISQSAGVNWRIETKGGKPVVRIGKSVPKQSEFSFFTSAVPQTADVLHEFIRKAPKGSSVLKDMSSGILRYQLSEERSTFTCPHCKGQTTMLRQRQQPKCPKCERLFQPSWQFCPVDGSKRPATPGEWKHCPLCGKQVDKDKSGKEKSKIELKEAEVDAEIELLLPPADRQSSP